jgi:hypothetical protein
MMTVADADRLRATIELLETVSQDAKLLTLKNLTLNNGGVWPIPEDPNHTRPAWYEMQLFGITVTADTADMLPVNWARAAHNLIKNIGLHLIDGSAVRFDANLGQSRRKVSM